MTSIGEAVPATHGPHSGPLPQAGEGVHAEPRLNARSLSPNQRAWARFKRNRIGYLSLWLFGVLLALTTFAELVSNDRPLVAR